MTIELMLIVGMTENDARQFLATQGFKMRVSKRDGKALMGTRDARPDRINVEIENGIVVGEPRIG